MRRLTSAFAALVSATVSVPFQAGCSTVESRLNDVPDFNWTTATPAATFNECFVRATAKESVSYLPRERGGTFKSSAGPQDYVFWLVTVEDLGAERRITVQAVNRALGRRAAQKVEGCIR